MDIRKTTAGDLDAVMNIYAHARDFMRTYGNSGQWTDGYPSRPLIARDIQSGASYVCESDGEIVAVFYYDTAPDPTYAHIDGTWLNDAPYGVVHRIARGPNASGAAAFCLDWCYAACRNVRVDTHCDNAPMRGLLTRLSFVHCGRIWLANGDERMAFQKI